MSILWVVERTAPHQHGWQHHEADVYDFKEEAVRRYDWLRLRVGDEYTYRVVEYRRVEL